MNAVAVAPEIEVDNLTVTTSDIAALAYRLWQERGCPTGSPEEDWYKAEELLVAASDR